MKRLSLVAAGLGLAGCWTLREPAYPTVDIPALPAGKTVAVQLAGFDAVFTSFIPVYGYVSCLGGPCHPWYGSSTVVTRTFVPRATATTMFLERASDTLEKAGCILKTANPTYRVEVKFEGPTTEDGDGWATFGWMVGTIFTADYGAQDWVAHLKVYDLRSGRLVHARDFIQRYEALVWGPIPIFSPSGSDKTSESVMQAWCLSALTDRASAAAVEYLRTAN